MIWISETKSKLRTQIHGKFDDVSSADENK
jgi:hypothetical protein